MYSDTRQVSKACKHSLVHYPLLLILRMMYYSVNDTGILQKRKSECSYQESNLRPSDYCTSSDALPLSYRRLVGAKAIKLGSWDKHRAYC